jgi:hypothetical protein
MFKDREGQPRPDTRAARFTSRVSTRVEQLKDTARGKVQNVKDAVTVFVGTQRAMRDLADLTLLQTSDGPGNESDPQQRERQEPLSHAERAFQLADSIHKADVNRKEQTMGIYPVEMRQEGDEQYQIDLTFYSQPREHASLADEISLAIATEGGHPIPQVGMSFDSEEDLVRRDYTRESDLYGEQHDTGTEGVVERKLTDADALSSLREFRAMLGDRWPEDLEIPSEEEQAEVSLATEDTKALVRTIARRLSTPQARSEAEDAYAPTFTRARYSEWRLDDETRIDVSTTTDGEGTPSEIVVGTSRKVQTAFDFSYEEQERLHFQRPEDPVTRRESISINFAALFSTNPEERELAGELMESARRMRLRYASEGEPEATSTEIDAGIARLEERVVQMQRMAERGELDADEPNGVIVIEPEQGQESPSDEGRPDDGGTTNIEIVDGNGKHHDLFPRDDQDRPDDRSDEDRDR